MLLEAADRGQHFHARGQQHINFVRAINWITSEFVYK